MLPLRLLSIAAVAGLVFSVACSKHSKSETKTSQTSTSDAEIANDSSSSSDTSSDELTTALLSGGRPGFMLADNVQLHADLNDTSTTIVGTANTGDIVAVLTEKDSIGGLPVVAQVRLIAQNTEGWCLARNVKVFDDLSYFNDFFVSTYLNSHDPADFNGDEMSEDFYHRAVQNPKLSRISQQLVQLYNGKFALVLNDEVKVDRRGNKDVTLSSGEQVLCVNLPPKNGAQLVVLQNGSIGTIPVSDLFIFSSTESWDKYYSADSLSQDTPIWGEPQDKVSVLFTQEFLDRASRNTTTRFAYVFQQKLDNLRNLHTEEQPYHDQ